MRTLIILTFIIAGIWYWQKDNSTKDVAFDETGRPIVLIFTVNNCDPCQSAVNFLKDRHVPFQEKKIDPTNDQDRDAKVWKRASDGRLPLILAGKARVAGMSKWELISLLGDNYGIKYLTHDEQKYFMKHFDANGSPKVVLYGTDWCPGCAELRKDFRDKGVSFIDIDVEKSGEFENVTRTMEIPGYPATWVGYTRVNGTSFDAVKAVMDKKTS
jgi:glutaredoxin